MLIKTLLGKAKSEVDEMKADFLRECMADVGQVPIDEFNAAYCLRCANRECSRSGLSAMSFDRRVANWQKDMFTNVPRASETDPRFASIRVKNFKTVNQPVSVTTPQQAPQPAVQQMTLPPDSPLEAPADASTPETTPEPHALVPETSHSETERVIEPPSVAAPQQTAYNTPFNQGVMLGTPEKPKEDVELGSDGTFVFGGNDE